MNMLFVSQIGKPATSKLVSSRMLWQLGETSGEAYSLSNQRKLCNIRVVDAQIEVEHLQTTYRALPEAQPQSATRYLGQPPTWPSCQSPCLELLLGGNVQELCCFCLGRFPAAVVPSGGGDLRVSG
jgi:hypothetical protein